MANLHLTQNERYQIYALRKAGHSIRTMAEHLGRSPSTISRELRRNRGRRGYRPAKAHEIACRRALRSRRQVRIDASQWQLVETLLRLHWSPEQIAHRTRLEGTLSISHEWIYRYIRADRARGGRLWKHLRQAHRRRRRYGTRGARRPKIRARIGIEHRPAHVENREELGHWEGDTIIGHGQKGAAVTLVERTSRYTRIGRLSQRDARQTATVIGHRLQQLSARVHTLTLDNGTEFALHGRAARALSAEIYFADPYAPWQRGSNENTNGLIRQYLPKRRRLDDLTESEATRIEKRLNHRPRKCLGFRTPHEVFNGTLTTITVALRS